MVARAPDPPEEDPEDDSDPFLQETRGRKKAEPHPKKRPAIEAAKSFPFNEWAPKFLKIRDVNGRLVAFTLNDIQQQLDDEYEFQLKDRGYVGMVILKPRKVGCSTWAQGKGFREVVEREGWHASIMAHEDSSCDVIFQRTKTYSDSLPDRMKRTMIRNNKKEISYAKPHESWIKVNVAKAGGGFGRGGDYHFNHFSETAQWPEVRGETKAESQTASIKNSMPEGVYGTAVLDESTARGKGNRFHKTFVDAQPIAPSKDNPKGSRYGRNGYRAMFFPWFVFKPYRKPGKRPEDYHADPDWLEDEPRLRRLGVDDEQLAWRRWCIAEKCDADLDTFKQEYPATADEAFLASGTTVFPQYVIQERLDEIEKAEKAETDAGFPPKRFSFDSKGQPEECRSGELRFYRSTRGKDIDQRDVDRYVIVADPAGSSANAPDQQKGDPACAYVWDREKNEQIAEWRGWCQPDEFASALFYLGALYSNPLMIVEAGPFGGHVISGLQRLGYRNLYFRENLGDQLLNEPTNWGQYGWITSAKTKPLMIDALREMWRNGTVRVNSAVCCEEHLTFVKKGPVKREAQSGCHDDTVMCCAIYAMWALHHPYQPRPTWQPKPAETYGDIMRDMLAKERSGRGQGGWRLW